MDNKDVEFLVEKRKLEETLKILNDEILKGIAKRKSLTEYILEYRKKFIEEYKHDEDAVIEFFDHERYSKEEAFKSIDRRLKEMTMLKESPYFGRITFAEEKENYPETLYIGRFGVTDEEEMEPVIVDWRAPVSSLFYHGSLGKATYQAPMGEVETDILGRRQIIVKKGQLEGIFDSAVDVKDEILQKVLSSNASDKLKDIVMTIQQEQDDIIRTGRDTNIMVDGVAGSGKTTVALHRIAYLLYNFRKILEGKVMILGPNYIFMEYISHVLPTLGESGVKQDTFVNFALNEIKGIEVMDFQNYIERIYRGDKDFINEVKYKNSAAFADFMDDFIERSEKEYFKIQDVKYFGEVIYSKEEIEKLFNEDYKYMPLFKRSEKIKRVITSRIKNKRDERVWQLNKEIAEYKKGLTPEELVLEELNLEFSRRIKIREIVREVMNSRDELDAFIKPEEITDLYNRINEYKPLSQADLAPILYLMVKLLGAKYKGDLKHVVIDEAQDYSLTQFKAIKEYLGCNSFTILGDSNQRLIKMEEKPAMLQLGKIFDGNLKEITLNKSYRSTNEIMEYADKYLHEGKIIPMVRSGKSVQEYKTVPSYLPDLVIKSVLEMQQDGLESIAIIKKSAEGLKNLGNQIKEEVNNVVFDKEDIIYKGGIVLIPSYFAKGLEFDGVIILDEEEAEEKTNGNLIKYIMCTRALHQLVNIKIQK